MNHAIFIAPLSVDRIYVEYKYLQMKTNLL